jgi:hypothetical protein
MYASIGQTGVSVFARAQRCHRDGDNLAETFPNAMGILSRCGFAYCQLQARATHSNQSASSKVFVPNITGNRKIYLQLKREELLGITGRMQNC